MLIGLIFTGLMIPANSICCPIDCVDKVCTTHTEHIVGIDHYTTIEYIPVSRIETHTIWHEPSIHQEVIVDTRPVKHPIKKPHPTKPRFHYNREWFPNGFCRITMEDNAPNGWEEYWVYNNHVQVLHDNGNVIYNINDVDICRRYREEIEYNYIRSCCHRKPFNASSSNTFINIINNIIPGWWETIYTKVFELIPFEHVEDIKWEKDIIITDCVPINNNNNDCNETPVPEPATMFLFGIGIVSFGIIRKTIKS